MGGAWTLRSEHSFDGVDAAKPFRELRKGKKLIADADALWRLFDRHWGSVAIVGDRAVVKSDDDGTAFHTIDRARTKGAPLRFAEDDLVVSLAALADHVVVSSTNGIAFLRVLPDARSHSRGR